MARVWLMPGMDGTGLLCDGLISELRDHDVRAVRYDGGTYDEAYASLPAALKEPTATDIIMAESFAGPLAIRIASAHRVARLVFVASFVKVPAWIPPGVLIAAIHPPPLLAIRKLMLDPDAPEQLAERVREVIGQVPQHWMASRLNAVSEVDASEAFRAVQSPMIWLRATGDNLVPDSATEHALCVRPDLEVYDVDGPHLLAQRNPSAVAGFLR